MKHPAARALDSKGGGKLRQDPRNPPACVRQTAPLPHAPDDPVVRHPLTHTSRSRSKLETTHRGTLAEWLANGCRIGMHTALRSRMGMRRGRGERGENGLTCQCAMLRERARIGMDDVQNDSILE